MLKFANFNVYMMISPVGVLKTQKNAFLKLISKSTSGTTSSKSVEKFLTSTKLWLMTTLAILRLRQSMRWESWQLILLKSLLTSVDLTTNGTSLLNVNTFVERISENK